MDVTREVHQSQQKAMNECNQISNHQSPFLGLPDSFVFAETFHGDQTSQEAFGVGALANNHHESMNNVNLACERNTGVAVDYHSDVFASSSNSEYFTAYSECSEPLPSLFMPPDIITTPATAKVSLKPPSFRSGSGLQLVPRARTRQLSHRDGVQDKAIRKRQATSGRSHLMKALNHLESVKKSLEHHKHFLAVVNHLEESIMQHMMTDHRNANAKAGLGSWDNDSAYQSMSQAFTTDETQSLAASIDLNLENFPESSNTVEGPFQISSQPDLMEIMTGIETPRATPAVVIYHCVFQKPGETCSFSTKRKCDWARHGESEGHFPQKRYMCISCIKTLDDEDGNPLCPYCFAAVPAQGNNKRHYLRCEESQKGKHIFAGTREEHFKSHFGKHHGAANFGAEKLSWTFDIQSDWPRECGFCSDRFTSFQEITDHIATHFRQGKDISDWRMPSGKGKGKAPRDERPRFDSKKWDDNDDDDGSDDNHFGGSGSGYKAGFAFASLGSSGSSQQTSSEYGSQNWSSFDYHQAAIRSFDSQIKVVDFLVDQLVTEEEKSQDSDVHCQVNNDSDLDTDMDFSELQSDSVATGVGNMVENHDRNSITTNDEFQGHQPPNHKARKSSRSNRRRTHDLVANVADDKRPDQLRPMTASLVMSKSRDLEIKYTPIVGRLSRAKRDILVHTCDVCRPARTFTRAEHLRRHQLSHQEPAYPCTFMDCERAFHRPDLLARHLHRHETQDEKPYRQDRPTTRPILCDPDNCSQTFKVKAEQKTSPEQVKDHHSAASLEISAPFGALADQSQRRVTHPKYSPSKCLLGNCRGVYEFPTLQSYQLHLKNVHYKNVYCSDRFPELSYGIPILATTNLSTKHPPSRHRLPIAELTALSVMEPPSKRQKVDGDHTRHPVQEMIIPIHFGFPTRNQFEKVVHSTNSSPRHCKYKPSMEDDSIQNTSSNQQSDYVHRWAWNRKHLFALDLPPDDENTGNKTTGTSHIYLIDTPGIPSQAKERLQTSEDLVEMDARSTHALISVHRGTCDLQLESPDQGAVYRVRLLDSLGFGKIDKLHGDIKPSNENTYEWGFDMIIQSSEWLNDSAGMLWIMGKSGSGKTSLINHMIPTTKNDPDNMKEKWHNSQPHIWPGVLSTANSSPIGHLLEALIRAHHEHPNHKVVLIQKGHVV